MYVTIELDKSRNFRYGMKAISKIEKKLKKPVAKIDFESLTMEDTATIMWAGLEHEDKGLTPGRVMDLVDEKGNFNDVMNAMKEAFDGAFGVEGEDEEGNERGKNE